MLSFAEITGFLDKNITPGALVTINGGEPALHPDFIKVIEYATKSGGKAALLTNGRRFSDKDFSLAAVKAGLKDIYIPVHGPNAQIHDEFTQSPGSFDETVSGIKNLFRLKEAGYPVFLSLKTLICKSTIKYLTDTVRFIATEFPKPDLLFIEGMDIVSAAQENVDKTLIPLAEAAPYVAEAVQCGLSFNQKVIIKDIPPCIFPNPEVYYPIIFHPSGEVQNIYGPVRQQENMSADGVVAKSPLCRECEADRLCGGVWHSYGQITGLSEFKPIKKLKMPLCLRS
jgi:MoaA/NifB/PqqE/SkfB family radical SAM enzyme